MSRYIRFLEVELSGFGCLGPERQHFVFQPDSINILIGPNESGKSTLAQAVFYLIFGIHQHDVRNRYRPWNPRAEYGGLLVLEAEGRRFRFSHDFEKGIASIEELDTDGLLHQTLFNDGIGKTLSRVEAQTYHQHVHDLLGPASQSFLQNSAFIRQAGLEVSLSDEISRIIAGLDRGSLEHVKSRLYDDYRQLTPRDVFSNRPLRNREVEVTESRLQSSKERLQEIESQARQHDSIIGNITRIDKSLQQQSKELEAEIRYFEKIEELSQNHDQVQRQLEKIEILHKEREQSEKQRAEIAGIENMLRRDFEEFLNAPDDLAGQLDLLIGRHNRLQALQEHRLRGSEKTRQDREKVEQLTAEIDRRFMRFRNAPEDFVAQLRVYHELLDQLRDIDTQVDRINADLQHLDRQIQSYGPLAEFNRSFVDEWYQARELQTRINRIQEHFDLLEERHQHALQRKSILSVLILLFGILVSGAALYFLPFGYGLFCTIMMGILMMISIAYVRRTTMRRHELRHGELMLQRQELEEALQQYFNRWGTDEIDLESRRDIDRFKEVEELRMRRARLIERRQELLEQDEQGEPVSSNEYLSRRSQLLASMQKFDTFVRECVEEDIEDILQQWREFERLREEILRLQSIIQQAERTEDTEFQQLESEIAQLSARLEPYLVSRTPEEARQRYDECRENLHTIQVLRDQLALQRPMEDVQRDLMKVETEYNRLARNREDLLEKHPEMRPLVDNQIELSRLMGETREKISSLERQNQELQDQLLDLKTQSAALHFGGDDIEVLKEQIEDDEEQIQRLKEHCGALEIALQTLEECEQDFHQVHMERLAQSAGDYFSEITGRRYNGVEFGADYTPIIHSRERSNLDAQQLSRGAQDQLYLALRFALARQLAGDACWPLILDDPFVNCDAERLQQIRTALENLAREHQVLLFSHDEAFAEWGNAIYLENGGR